MRAAGAQVGVFRGRNESEEGFKLRVASVQSRPQLSRGGGDPLRIAAEKAIASIQQHALGMDAYERKRNYPKAFNPSAIVGADGKPILKPHLLPEMRTRLQPVKR